MVAKKYDEYKKNKEPLGWRVHGAHEGAKGFFFFFLFNSGVDGVTEQKKVNVATSTEELFGNNPHRGYCILHTCGYIPLECETR